MIGLALAGAFFPLFSGNAQVRKLGPEFQVNTFTPFSQYEPAITTLGDDQFIVVWLGPNPVRTVLPGIRGQRFSRQGERLGSEFLITSGATDDDNVEQLPSVAAARDGSFVVAWESYYSSDDSDIFAQRFDSTGAPLAPQLPVNMNTEGAQKNPKVASSVTGDFVVVWTDRGTIDNYKAEIRARQFDGETLTAGPELELTMQSGLTRLARFGAVDVGADGSFIVVWQQGERDGDGLGIVGQRFSSTGVRQGDEFLVNTYTTGAQGSPELSIQPQGTFVVVWESYGADGDGLGVFARRFAADGLPLTPEFQVNSYTPYHQALPSIDSDEQGNFVVIWESYDASADGKNGQDGSGRGIFGQWFDETAQRLGREFQVNTFTAGDQGNHRVKESDVAVYPDGDFVAVWFSPDQDGDRGGIFGQRFHTDPALGPLCGDAQKNDLVLRAADALAVMRAAVGLAPCELCICDTDSSSAVTAADALRVLVAAVGVDVQLTCPPCA